MTVLTINDAVIAALSQASGPAELRNEKGDLVGFYTPVGQKLGFRTGPFTEADIPEIERRKASARGGKRTWEVFERLKTLTTDPAEQEMLQVRIDEMKKRHE